MSALARFFKMSGCRVAGYDRTPGPVTEALLAEGIEVVFNDDIEIIPDEFFELDDTLVVYTPAVPSSQKQLSWFNDKGFRVLKRSKVLGMITEDLKSICIAGTHGKTTVSTMTAYLFYNSEIGANAFLGGIAKNFRTNFLGNKDSDFVILEADEFDRSFWQLTPYSALITSMDADHLDVYGTSEEVKDGFFGFADRIRKNGKLLIKSGLAVSDNLAEGVSVFTYSLSDEADYRALNLKEHNGQYTFDLETPRGVLSDFMLGIPGLINVENAVAALALCIMNGVRYEELREALPRFEGIARRFDVVINTPGLIYIDDYAHHPEEIRATLKSVRHAHPGKTIAGVFQPHLYSRTRDFATEFAAALNEGLDKVLLLPVYPAREEPIPGADSGLIASLMDKNKCSLIEKEELISSLDKLNFDVLISMGAGDIDRLVPEIRDWGMKKEAGSLK